MLKPLFADDSPKQLPIEPEKTPAPSRTLDHRFSGARPISSSSFVHILAILLVASSTWRWGNNDRDKTFKAQQWSRPSRQQWSRQHLQGPTINYFPAPTQPGSLSSMYPQWQRNAPKSLKTVISHHTVSRTFCWKSEENPIIVDLWQKLKNSEKLQRSHAPAKRSQDCEILKRCWNIEIFNQDLKPAVI